jgi:light-regulated signal transduction histidine kinase (bacteriophytochrome)
MITVFSQLLVKTYPPNLEQEANSYIATIVDGTRRMRELLADLLAYTEIGSGPDEANEAVELEQIVERVKQNLVSSIGESGASISAGALPSLRANSAHLISLFQNLITNSIKYRSAAPPRIEISAKAVNGQWEFAVKDNGMGIEPEYHDKIFEVFRRLHGKRIPGTGIGLAICQRVVERYSGRIWVESEVGNGSTFRFILPKAAAFSAEEN